MSRVAAKSKLAWSKLTSKKWSAAFGHWINDVRAALKWAFSTTGDESLGINLTMDTLQLWTQLALMQEYREHVERALLAGGREVRLSGILGNILFHTLGPLADTRTSAAFERSLEAARAASDRQSELFAYSGLCAVAVTHGDYPAGLALAERFDETLGLAGKVARDRALAHVEAWELRTATSYACSLRDTGRLADARALLAPVLESFTEGLGSTDVKRAAEVLVSLRSSPQAGT